MNRKREPADPVSAAEEVRICPASELYMGVDGLRDEYTILGKNCVESPHYELMRACDSGNLQGCDYVDRERKGALDGRDCFYKPDRYHIEVFQKRIREIDMNAYEPVKVYVVNSVKYLADGKHRAVLLAYLEKPIRYVPITLSPGTLEYMQNLRRLMKWNPEIYSKNLKLIDEIFRSTENRSFENREV